MYQMGSHLNPPSSTRIWIIPIKKRAILKDCILKEGFKKIYYESLFEKSIISKRDTKLENKSAIILLHKSTCHQLTKKIE